MWNYSIFYKLWIASVKIGGESLLTLWFRVSFAISEEILSEENLGFIDSGKGNPYFSLCKIQALAFFFMKIHNVSIIPS
jgi:hypothetical protein